MIDNTKLPVLQTTSISMALVGFAAGLLFGTVKPKVKAYLKKRYPSSVEGKKLQNPTEIDLLAAAEDIIAMSNENVPGGTCVIASIDATTGAPRVRPINPLSFCLKSDPYVLFFTNRQSRKYRDFQTDNRAELNFMDPHGMGYLSLTGTVEELPSDQAKGYWKPRLQFFIQEGPQGEEGRFTVFRLVPNKLEIFCLRLGLNTTCHKDWAPWTMEFPTKMADST